MALGAFGGATEQKTVEAVATFGTILLLAGTNGMRTGTLIGRITF